MTVTFGRLGRAFLLAGAALVVAGLVVWLLVDNLVAPLTVGGVGLIALLQGTMWTVIQGRMFGSVAAVRRTAATGRPAVATVVGVHGTSSSIGSEPIARLDLVLEGRQVTRHVRIPFNHTQSVRHGLELPVRVDPAGSRAMVVDWERLR